MHGLAGGDYLAGGEGKDVLFGDGSINPEMLNFTPASENGADVLDGGDGDDSLYGQGGQDKLIGGSGNDSLWGDDKSSWFTDVASHGADYLSGGMGQDKLYGGGGDDRLFGGMNSDELWGDDATSIVDVGHHGNDYLNGEEGEDTLIGGGLDDQLFGGADNDTLFGDDDGLDASAHGRDYLDGESGDDSLIGGGLDDELFGGEGKDTLWGDDSEQNLSASVHGNDYLDGEDDDDQLVGCGGDDTLLGGTGADKLWGDTAEEFLKGEAHGRDLLDGGEGADELLGGGSDDQLIGGDGNDTLLGDDTLDNLSLAAHGNDILDGGAGDDVFWGGGGDDTLYGGIGNDWLSADTDTEILAAVSANSAGGLDAVYGDEGDDTMVGGGGGDYLNGGVGDDLIVGGAGNDTLVADSGYDRMLGGEGDDRYELAGAALYLDDNLALDSPTSEPARSLRLDTIEDASGSNTVTVDGDVDLASMSASGTDAILKFSNDGMLRIRGAFASKDGKNSTQIATNSQSVDLLSWAQEHMQGGVNGAATAENRFLFGGLSNDTLSAEGTSAATLIGGKGNDTYTVSSQGGSDIVVNQGDGNDTVLGKVSTSTVNGRDKNRLTLKPSVDINSVHFTIESGITYLAYGAGDDKIAIDKSSLENLYRPFDEVRLETGQNITWEALLAKGVEINRKGPYATAQLDGSSLNDTFNFSFAPEKANGKSGNDTYLWGKLDGNDTIQASSDARVDKACSLKFKSGLSPSDLTVRRVNDDLIISVTATSDSITIEKYFGTAVQRPIQELTFTDSSTVWNQSAIDLLIYKGGSGNDNITGSTGADRLDGGTGNDTLYGGNGANTYVFGRGYGHDVIRNYNTDASGTGNDTLRMIDGLTKDDVTLIKSPINGEMIIQIRGSSDQIIIDGQFKYNSSNPYPIDTISFDNGTNITQAEIQALALQGGERSEYIYGTSSADSVNGQKGDDDLYGQDGGDSLYGGTGDDILYGEVGNDILQGDQGDDTLYGGSGADTYQFNLGDGQDVIFNNDTDTPGTLKDTLKFGERIDPDSIIVRQNSSLGLELLIKGTKDQITIENQFRANSNDAIDRVMFFDGSAWNATLLTALSKNGSALDDTLYAYAQLPTTLFGGVGRDTLYGGSSADELHGDAGSDFLYGNDGQDILDGGSGNDNISGEAGNDRFILSEGTDTLSGGSGDDTYFVQYGTGISIIASEAAGSTPEGTDNILISKDIKSTDVSLSRYNYQFGYISNAEYMLTIQSAIGTRQIVICNEANQNESNKHSIDEIRFEGGQTLSLNDINNIIYKGTERLNPATNDSVVGTSERDTLSAGVGHDTINGSKGDDELNGGSDGGEVFYFTGADGHDTVSLCGNNEIQFAPDVSSSSIKIYTDVRQQGLFVFVNEKTGARIFTQQKQYDPANQLSVKFMTGTSSWSTLWDNQYIVNNALALPTAENWIDKGGGNDLAQGSVARDFIYGNAGNDTLDGGINLAPGSMPDMLYGGAGTDTFIFGQGRIELADEETAQATTQSDIIKISDNLSLGDLYVTSNQEKSLIVGVRNSDSNITIYRSFDESYESRVKISQIQFANGDKSLNATDIQTLLHKATDDDNYMWSSNTGEVLSGGNGNDTLNGQSGADVLNGGVGLDRLLGGENRDALNGDAGDDVLSGEAGDDTLDGGEGQDYLEGGPGSDTFKFDTGFGRDTIDGSRDSDPQEIDRISFGSGIDPSLVHLAWVIDDNSQNPDVRLTIDGSTDSILIRSAPQDFSVDEIFFTKTSETWNAVSIREKLHIGTGLNDSLSGDATSNVIFGGAGDDTIDGLGGVDLIYGGSGVNTYKFNRGYGALTITEGDESQQGGVTQIQFGSDIGPDDITVSAEGDDLLLMLKGSDDCVRIKSILSFGNSSRLDVIKFQLSPTWSWTDVQNRLFGGTNASDKLYGSSSFDSISGMDGNDRLFGFEGEDTLHGNAGADTLYGGDDVDYLYGDTLNDELQGDLGDDYLDGGDGDDTLTGGDGNDTYWFAANSGHDYVSLDSSDGRSTDEIAFDRNITKSNIRIYRSATNSYRSDSLFIGSANANDVVEVLHYFGPNISMDAIDIRLMDGSLLDQAAINSASMKGTPLSDYIVGNDSLSTNLRGYAGNDTIYGGQEVDYINGGDDNDLLFGGGLGDSLTGSSGQDSIYGEAGDDTLDGGTGDDLLSGGEGSNTFYFSRGSGVDTIVSATDGVDTIEFTDNITRADLSAQIIDGTRLLIRIIGSNDGVIVNSQAIPIFSFSDGDKLQPYDTIQLALTGTDRSDFLPGSTRDDNILAGDSDDTVYGGAGVDRIYGGGGCDILSGDGGNDTLRGDDGNDSLNGDANDDSLYGDAGADTLNGGAGNDSFYGGAGDDVMVGGTLGVLSSSGNDTYFFDDNSGSDVVIDTDTSGTDSDTIEFQGLITAEKVDIYSDGANLVLSCPEFYQVISVNLHFASDFYAIENIKFSDGMKWDKATINGIALANYQRGSLSSDVIEGADESDKIYGLDGDDQLNGAGSQDFLFGGLGSDILNGGAGNDWLAGGNGADQLNGGTGQDAMFGGAGDDYYYVDNANDRVVELIDAQHPIDYDTVESTISYQAGDNIEALIAAGEDGINLTSNDDGCELYGNIGNNYLKGGANTDVITGGGGLDTMEGGAGDDFYLLFDNKAKIIENPGGGYDQILAYANNITMADNVEKLTMATNAPITATGNDSNNYIAGNGRGNNLSGMKGNDRLFGKAGNDTLTGGLGDDTIDGGSGDDHYMFNTGDGADTIIDTEVNGLNSDQLAFLGAIRSDQLWFAKSGNNLQISLIGTSDKVTINNWYIGDNNKIESITAQGNGKTLSYAKVNDLVNAMAEFTAPAAGQTTLPTSYQSAFGSVIASSWS